jgi:NitT/TauT family transport system substrate-binding protein
MPTRRTIMRAALGSALVTAGCSTSKTKSAPKSMDKITMQTGFGATGDLSYYWVAQAKGFFKDVNIDVTITPGAAGDANLTALGSGKVDFTSIDYSGGVIRGGTGAFDKFRMVSYLHYQTLIAFVCLSNNGITTATDLAHKKLAQQAGSVHKTLFPTYAKLAGFDPTTVTWVDGTPQTLPSMLISKNVDGIGLFITGAPNAKHAAQQAGRDIVILPYGQYLTDLYGAVLTTRAELIQKNPDLVRRATSALMKGLEYTVQNPHEAATILKAAVPATDVDTAAAAAAGLAPYVHPGSNGAPLGALDPQRVARGIALLQGLGTYTTGYDPTKICDFSIISGTAK